jgi:biopolymer transport protein ExbB
MKTFCTVFFVFFSSFLLLPCQAADSWEETVRKVLVLSGQMDERSLFSERFAHEDRAVLEKRMGVLKKSIAANTQALEQATQKLNQISAQRAKLADQYQSETADMKTVEGNFRTALGHTLARFDLSPVAAMYPEKRQALKRLLKQEYFPGLEQIQAYTSVVFSDIKATGTIEGKRTRIIGTRGQVREVNLLRAGGFFLGYRDSEGVYFVLPQADGPGLSIRADGALSRSLEAWLKGESDELPLDISDGTAIRAFEQTPDMESWVEDGGVLLYPILAAGIIGALFTVLKTFHLLLLKRLGQRKKKQVFDQTGSLETVRDILLKIKRCPAARVMETGFCFEGRTINFLDNVVEEKILAEQGKLERFLSIIGVLASIAPLLGLLGTVTGMIDTFRAITLFGTGDPRMMSTGISEALVTTQAGLGIAIPLLLAHHFLKRRVALLVADMEECGMGVIARLSAG